MIDRLNSLCVRPCSELEKRVVNALHFYRIGRNHSPQEQEIFYYVAAIENLIIGENDRDVLRWKFSERGAFLLEDNLSRRLEMVTKLKRLYDARSTIAHGNVSQGDAKIIAPTRDYLRRIIMKILELIDERGLQSVSPSTTKDGSSLDEYVDQVKYSGKPRAAPESVGTSDLHSLNMAKIRPSKGPMQNVKRQKRSKNHS